MEFPPYPIPEQSYLRKRESADLFNRMLIKAGLDPKKAALGLSGNTIHSYATPEGRPIPQNKLAVIFNGLKPNLEDMFKLVRLVAPDIDEDYVKKQLAETPPNVEHLAFPALDPEWLGTHDKRDQIGLLLRTLRERKGWSRQELSNAARVPFHRIQKAEELKAGLNRVELQRIGEQFSEEEREYWNQCVTSRPMIKIHLSQAQKIKTERENGSSSYDRAQN